MRLKGLDLNLLVALDALLDERSVSRAAERLHLSQPAASAALGRLRDYFNDELLVLHGKRLIPTSHAESLAPAVKRILSQVDDIIALSTVFEPGRSERTFRIMASDYITTVLIPSLVAALHKLAPGIELELHAYNDPEQPAFERGEVDLILTPQEFVFENHPAELLFNEQHVVVGWNENPVFEQQLTEATFLECGHVAVAFGQNRSLDFAGRQLESMGKKRRVEIFAQTFSVVPWLLLGTNRLAVMHERLALAFAPFMPLKLAPMPFDFPAMHEMVQYHQARESDLGLRWLRRLFQQTAAKAPPRNFVFNKASG